MKHRARHCPPLGQLARRVPDVHAARELLDRQSPCQASASPPARRAPGVHAARKVLGQEGGQEGRQQVVDALHVPAGRMPAQPMRSGACRCGVWGDALRTPAGRMPAQPTWSGSAGAAFRVGQVVGGLAGAACGAGQAQQHAVPAAGAEVPGRHRSRDLDPGYRAACHWPQPQHCAPLSTVSCRGPRPR